MAKSRTSFKAGNVPKSPGRPPLPDDVKLLVECAKIDLIKAYCAVANRKPSDIEKDEPRTVIEKAMTVCLGNFMASGNTSEIARIWDRVIGKPVETHSIETTEGDAVSVTLNILDARNNGRHKA